jgi:hypothetical protein
LDVRGVIVDGEFDALDDSALTFGADLLSALEGDEGELEVMGCLLERGPLVWLMGDGGVNQIKIGMGKLTHQ